MSAKIYSYEDHQTGKFYVKVNFNGRWEPFESVMDCQKWLRLMKESSRGEIEKIEVILREIFIGLKSQTAYETEFAM